MFIFASRTPQTLYHVKKKLFLLLKILGGTLGVIVLLLVVAAVLLNTESVQKKLLDYATEQLEEKLQTKVTISEVSVDVFKQKFNMKGLEVEDLEHRKMLELELLSVSVDISDLVTHNKLVISKAGLEGVKACLIKPEDGPANFQFIIDAFKPNKSPEKKKEEKKDESKKEPFKLDINHLWLARIEAQYNDNQISLGKLTVNKNWFGQIEGKLSELQGKWELQTKKGPETATFDLRRMDFFGGEDKPHVRIDGLHMALDNHLPRKNTNKPKRGFFDVGHLDVTANLKLDINHIGKDTLNATLTQFVARDSVTGFDVKDIRFNVGATKEKAHLKNITVQQGSTVLKFDSATIVLPSKKEGRKLSFQTSVIKGRTELRDISRPFAPVLKNFKMPLELTVLFSGTDTTLVFRDIHVNTPDQRLKIDAVGGIEHLKEKQKLYIHFHVNNMTAKGKVKQEIIQQFPVKKLMMNQLDALGDIGYTGNIIIPWKKEIFNGVLRTAAGSLTFNLTLDEITKYLTGHVNTRIFHLGQVVTMKGLGDVGLKADFKVDIHKQRTAVARKQHGGKMPIGDVQADVYEVTYKKVKIKNLQVNITSNGGLVEGSIDHPGKGMEWGCDFTFTDIDDVDKKLKIKPRMKLKLKDIFKKKSSVKEEKPAKETSSKDKNAKKSSADTTKTKKPSFFKRLFGKKKKDD